MISVLYFLFHVQCSFERNTFPSNVSNPPLFSVKFIIQIEMKRNSQFLPLSKLFVFVSILFSCLSFTAVSVRMHFVHSFIYTYHSFRFWNLSFSEVCDIFFTQKLGKETKTTEKNSPLNPSLNATAIKMNNFICAQNAVSS